MSYNSTSTILESFGDNFDEQLYKWKDEMEKDYQKETALQSLLNDAHNVSDQQRITSITKEICDHQTTMHPGYSFTGDNVDIRVHPRQMTMKNQASDIHMFQYVAFKNRFSGSHLSNNVSYSDIPLTTFLPSITEQRLLVEELTVLVGQIGILYSIIKVV